MQDLQPLRPHLRTKLNILGTASAAKRTKALFCENESAPNESAPIAKVMGAPQAALKD